MSKSFRIFCFDSLRGKYVDYTSCSSLASLKKKLVSLRSMYDINFRCLAYDPSTTKLQFFMFNDNNLFFKFPEIDFSKDSGKFYKAAVDFTNLFDDYEDYLKKNPDDVCSPLIYIYRNFDRVIRFHYYIYSTDIIEPTSIIELGGNL